MNTRSTNTAFARKAFWRRLGTALLGVGILVGGFVAGALAQAAPDYATILAAPDRSDADRQNDKRREPAKLLAFAGVRPGITALDMGADAGYSTDIIARVVGPNGKVYSQNTPDMSDRLKTRYEQRLKTLPVKNVVEVLRPMDDPVPPEAKNVDLITFFFAYHDTVYNSNIDRAKMNRAMFAALKPGGSLVIADHAAAPGAGLTVVKTLHRIDEQTLRQEIEAAGFKFVAEGTFLRHPDDPHNQPIFQRRENIDDFLLRFEKPR